MKKSIFICSLFFFFLMMGSTYAQQSETDTERRLKEYANKEQLANDEMRIDKKNRVGKLFLDVTPLSLTFSGTFPTKGKWHFGFGAGIGVDLATLILAAGSHFATDYGIAFEDRDRDKNGNGKFREFVWGQLFAHGEINEWFQLDVGFKGSYFFYLDSTETSESVLGLSYGVFFRPAIGGEKFSFGPRFFFGQLNDPAASEFSILMTPIILRFTF